MIDRELVAALFLSALGLTVASVAAARPPPAARRPSSLPSRISASRW